MGMAEQDRPSNTGLPGLDKILDHVWLGDNVVLQVDSIDDYVRFVTPFCREAERQVPAHLLPLRRPPGGGSG